VVENRKHMLSTIHKMASFQSYNTTKVTAKKRAILS